MPASATSGAHGRIFEGPLLWAVLVHAGVVDPAKHQGDVRSTVMLTGQDGYAAVLALGELSPEFENKQVIVALRMDGQPLEPGHLRVVLPVEAVSGLLMTLPRVLQAALDRRGDGCARVVQPLGAWRLERAAYPGWLILTLSTPDEFSVAFVLGADELAAMAEAGHRPGTPLPARVVN